MTNPEMGRAANNSGKWFNLSCTRQIAYLTLTKPENK